VNALPDAIGPNAPLIAVADLIRKDLRSLDRNEQEWVGIFADFCEHVLFARDMLPDDRQFGEWWTREGFEYQGRPLGKNDRADILKIARRLRQDPDQALIEISRARSRKPRTIARTLPSASSVRRRPPRFPKTGKPPQLIHGDGTRAPGAQLYEAETAADWRESEIDSIVAALEVQADKIRSVAQKYGTLAEDDPLLKLARSIDRLVKRRAKARKLTRETHRVEGMGE
jgi:hypothetical protein